MAGWLRPGTSSRRALAAVSAALLVTIGVGCSSGSANPGGTATVRTSVDPWAVPAVITVPYVNRVLAELNHIDGDAIRSARAANAITPKFQQLEMATSATPQEFQLVEQVWTKTKTNGWTNISPSPGDVVSTVLRLTDASASCVVAKVRENLQPEGPGGVGIAPQWWVALLPHPPSAINPTHWAFVFNGYETSPTPGGVPINACAGT
jgi:hypothetical protein